MTSYSHTTQIFTGSSILLLLRIQNWLISVHYNLWFTEKALEVWHLSYTVINYRSSKQGRISLWLKILVFVHAVNENVRFMEEQVSLSVVKLSPVYKSHTAYGLSQGAVIFDQSNYCSICVKMEIGDWLFPLNCNGLYIWS